MEKLLQGIKEFQENIFESLKDTFDTLAKGQQPETLFITCSDSRIDPNLVTQTKPGELFVIRNAGNMIPPYSPSCATGEAATVEYAVSALGVKEIIVCGHSQCGAMGGLLDLDHLDALPTVKSWLGNAASTLSTVKQKYPDATGDELLAHTIQSNVLAQLDNLRTHPSVAAAVATGNLKLTGWVYRFETGEVFRYNEETRLYSSVFGGEGSLLA